jgi:hypothetical protein
MPILNCWGKRSNYCYQRLLETWRLLRKIRLKDSKGYEAMAMIRKGQIQNVDRDDVTGQLSFIHQIFGIAT